MFSVLQNVSEVTFEHHHLCANPNAVIEFVSCHPYTRSTTVLPEALCVRMYEETSLMQTSEDLLMFAHTIRNLIKVWHLRMCTVLQIVELSRLKLG
jgi:hypothetical protein